MVKMSSFMSCKWIVCLGQRIQCNENFLLKLQKSRSLRKKKVTANAMEKIVERSSNRLEVESDSSGESDTHTTVVSMSKRWTTLETVGRCMLLFSVAFFIVGFLITVVGFSNIGIPSSQQIPLQIMGPVCLTMTIVMWVIGCVFSRLWTLEWKRQQQALELRDRVQLHALAMDILNNPVLSPGMLQDPQLRRQLLLKLRAQKTFDLSSPDDLSRSRRSSRALSVDSKRRLSSVQYDKLVHYDTGRRKSKDQNSDEKPVWDSLPGIQISRFETFDRSSIASGSVKSSKRYIIIHSDVPSDFSRLSCPSDYSLAGSRSSRSRSSRASSGVSSRLWDFSPRDSEWDADVSLGSRESQLSILKQDWSGGPSDIFPRDENCQGVVGSPRKLSVVTFDMGSPSVRRHSSPAYAMYRKDSAWECTCGRVIDLHQKRFSEDIRLPPSLRKKSTDQSLRSIRIDEDDHDDITEEIENAPLKSEEHNQTENKCQLRPPLRRNNTDDSEVERRVARLFREIEFSLTDSVDESKIQSCSSDHDASCLNKSVETKEIETQTLTETEIQTLLGEVIEINEVQDNGAECEVHLHPERSSHLSPKLILKSCEHGSENKVDEKSQCFREKKSKFSVLSRALANFGFKSQSSDTKPKTIPNRFLLKVNMT